MKRFNKTTKGYRFDKIIFYSATFLVLVILGMTILKYGFSFKPYFKCSGVNLDNNQCENPFYNNKDVSCRWFLGFKDCSIEHEKWMDQEFLPIGEYGTRPPSFSYFYLVVFSAYLLAFIINHLIHNKGMAFHFNALDYAKKLNDNEREEDGRNKNNGSDREG